MTSIDISKEFDSSIICDINNKLPFNDNSFDLIWCSEVIEHVDNPIKTLAEFRRTLKPKGKMILTTPNSYFWIGKILMVFGMTPKKLQRKDHKHFFSIKDIKIMFPNARLYGYFPYMILKFKIRRLIGLLSPTFVISETKILGKNG